MKIEFVHEGSIMPVKSSTEAGAFDLFMPEAGSVAGEAVMIPLGIKTEIPKGWAALLLPRSGVGAKHGLELNNTVGLIDSDYRGQWMAKLRTKSGLTYSWAAGERVLQFILVPCLSPVLQKVDKVLETTRSEGGFGSTGN